MLGFAPDQLQQLQHIQVETLRHFVYTSDQVTHGLVEYWPTFNDVKSAILDNATFREDCDGFAIVCMNRAMQAGFKARLVVCQVETGEGHCICEVTSYDETQAYYFDNRRKTLVAAKDEINYKFVAVGPWNPQPGDQRPWHLVDND